MEINTEDMKKCTLCPRDCGVNRSGSGDGHGAQSGYCGQSDRVRIARAALHFWEEPCVSGRSGSGAVFFGGCNMRCVFCQNHDIAIGQRGQIVSEERLSDIFLELQKQGANNINLVTPSHYVPQIVRALRAAKQNGLKIPIVYNTSSYEKAETLRMLEGLVDIYLPDMKYSSSQLAARYSNAPDYFEVAMEAITEMVRQVGEPVFEAADGKYLNAEQMNAVCEAEGEGDDPGQKDADFLIKKGVIVRHLVMPGQAEDSKAVLWELCQTFGDRIYISIMNQYTPMRHFEKYPELNSRVTEEEYDDVLEFAVDIGLENVFVQEGDTARDSFIPAFDGEGVLPEQEECDIELSGGNL